MTRKKLIFGSAAAKHWFPDFRDPKDLDCISPESQMSREVQHYWVPTFEEILNTNKDNTYVDPEILLTIKLSHAGWDIHWSKTMCDILLLKSKGLKADKILYKKLVKDWIGVHGKKWASLKGKDSNSFFEDPVPRKYVHDTIHEAVAVYDRPLYERTLKDGVLCCESKFEELSENDKVLMVKEEVWVTALERYLIPSDLKCSPTMAYQKSLKKLCTTMSSGWFKFFILDNFDKLCKDNGHGYIQKFKLAEQNNKLKLA